MLDTNPSSFFAAISPESAPAMSSESPSVSAAAPVASSSSALPPPSPLPSPSPEADEREQLRSYLLDNAYVPAYASAADPSPLDALQQAQLYQQRFRNWDAYTISMKPEYQIGALASLAGVYFFRNEASKNIAPTSVYLAPSMLEPAVISDIVFFDLDQTITRAHSYLGPGTSYLQLHAKMGDAGREENLRHADKLRALLVKAKARHVCLAVITRHHSPINVLAYLQTLVSGIEPDAKVGDYFSLVLCSHTSMAPFSVTQGMKDGELNFALELLLRQRMCKTPIRAVLVDDDICNSPMFTTVDPAVVGSPVTVLFNHAEVPGESQTSSFKEDAYLDALEVFIQGAGCIHIQDDASAPSCSSGLVARGFAP